MISVSLSDRCGEAEFSPKDDNWLRSAKVPILILAMGGLLAPIAALGWLLW